MEQEDLTCSIDCQKPYSDGIESVTALLVGCAVVLMLLCLEWSFRNKDLLSHYFEYSIVFTTGAILATLALFSWPLNDSQLSCNVKPVLTCLGGGLMFGIFVARVRKIWVNFVWLRRQSLVKMRQIINSKRMEREPKVILGGILSLEVFLLLLFFSVPAFRPTCVCTEFQNEDRNFSHCSFNASFGTLVLCVNFFPLAFSAFYGYEILKEFKENSELTEYDYNYTKSTTSIRTIETGITRNTTMSSPSKSKSFSTRYNSSDKIYIGEILGVRQDEIDEFKPIFISVSAITFLGLFIILISVLNRGFEGDSNKRAAIYVVRTIIGLCMTCIPVFIIYARAYSLVTLKQYRLRSEEEKENIERLIKHRGRKSMSERVVRAVASFRGTLPGDTPSPWRSSTAQTGSTGITRSASSSNSFFSQFKTRRNKETKNTTQNTSSNSMLLQNRNIREKLAKEQPKEKLKQNDTSESLKMALS